MKTNLNERAFLNLKKSQLQSPPLRSLEPPNFNLPSQGDTSSRLHDDSALPSIKQDLTTQSSEMRLDEHSGVEPDVHHEVHRYPITTIDFSRVETPFIIGVWILFASIAKIGE